MSSSEEYLDNLLKALLESENASSAGAGKNESDSPEELFASMGGMTRKADAEAVEEHRRVNRSNRLKWSPIKP